MIPKTVDIVDIRGVSFQPLQKPFRVVSLVPSWTETLFDLGLTGTEIVGRTDYCRHPRGRVADIEKLGGPKNPNVGRIFELDPDLVIADREENRKEDVERMDVHWVASRVFVTGPKGVDHALNHVEQLGTLFGTQDQARELIERVRSSVNQVVREDRGTVAYLTWQDPMIAASRKTYIGDVLETLGYKNVCDYSTLEGLDPEGSASYPVVTLEILIRLKPNTILLSTEPFPFRKKHLDRLRSRLRELDPEYAERVRIRIVNGEYFSWYGSRMLPAFRYFVRRQAEF